jgi:membrane associated rhomboid family serine protease
MIPLRDVNPSTSTPVVTLALIAVNIAVFLYEVTLDPYSRNHFITACGVVPARLQVQNLFTSIFVHGGWLHLIGNMWFLWIFGDNIEDILGRWRYLFFYLATGIAASAAQIAVSPDSRVPMVGASGAIAGVMGAYLLRFPHARVLTLVPILIFFTTFELPALVILIYWLALQLFSGFGQIGDMHLARGGVAFFAHIGGFAAGMGLISLMRTHRSHWRRSDLSW